jgi:hypothetical protein
VNIPTEWIFAASITSGLLSARVDSALMNAGLRGSSEAWETLVTIAGALNGIACIALFVWAFVTFPWYVPLAIFVGQGLLLGPLIRAVGFFVLSLSRPLLASVCVAGAAWCWISWLAAA